MLANLRKEIRANSDKVKASQSAKYFKSGAGEYGEGDLFLGITVPIARTIAKKYQQLGQDDLEVISNSKFHEERLIALLILNLKYSKAATNQERVAIFEYWLKLVRNYKVNNWDLIDTSAPVMGEILSRHLGYGAPFIHALASSNNLWERRAAIMLTFPLIKIGKFGPTLAIAKDLISDKEDLIHKATGWMLREVGNRDQAKLTEFLIKHKTKMPRTMLRYAIEKYSPKQRAAFMNR